VTARTTGDGVVAEYELAGKRAGAYLVTTGASLVHGNLSVALAHPEEATVRAEPGKARFVATFSNAALAETYRWYATSAKADDDWTPTEWRVDVWLRPALDAADAADIGIVERARLGSIGPRASSTGTLSAFEPIGGSALASQGSGACPVDPAPLDALSKRPPGGAVR
jgi:hypothetical protein